MASKATAAPAMDKRPEPVAPFKAHKHGVRAHGTVSRIGEAYRTSKHVQVTIRHGKPKKDGEYSPLDDGHETQVTMPAHLAKRFPHGKKVSVHVFPRGSTGMGSGKGPQEDIGDSEGEGGEETEGKAAKLTERGGGLIRKAFAKRGAK